MKRTKGKKDGVIQGALKKKTKIFIKNESITFVKLRDWRKAGFETKQKRLSRDPC